MKVFVARQPIFDQRQRVFAYELLFRSGDENAFSYADGDYASQYVMSHSLHVFGLHELTQGKRAFINFTRSLLVQKAAMLLPPDKVAVEILELVEPDEEVVHACQTLKEGGYLLALDDAAAGLEDEPLIALADIIKVDFRAVQGDQRRAFAERFVPRRIKLVAEKVETQEDFAEAVALGYDYVQGYFFCRPEIVVRDDIPSNKLTYLRFLREINQPDVDLDRLEQIIKQDVALSVKLLRYINSAWFGLANRVKSLRHALTLLGIKVVRQWVSLVAVTGLGYDRPAELVATCLVRAAFCERLAPLAQLRGRESDLFLVGLFSSLDALIGRPLDELLGEVALPEAVRDALLGCPNPLNTVYRLVLGYEHADWDTVLEICAAWSIDHTVLPEIYEACVQWSAEVTAT